MKKLLIIIGIAFLFACEKEEVRIYEEKPIQYQIIFELPCYECNWGYVEMAHGRMQGSMTNRMMRKDVTHLFKFAGGEIVIPVDGTPEWVTFYYAGENCRWAGLQVEITNIKTIVNRDALEDWYRTIKRIKNPVTRDEIDCLF